jgi:hypothetical protein
LLLAARRLPELAGQEAYAPPGHLVADVSDSAVN